MRWMRPALFFVIQRAKRHRKKKNLPDEFQKLDDEWVQKAIRWQDEWDSDCLTLDEKDRKGLLIEKVELPSCNAWLLSSDKNPKDRVLYYIHGGGFAMGNTRFLVKTFFSYLVNTVGYNVFSVDYRLMPRWHCLDAVSDCEDGYRHLLQRYDPKKIVLIGDSAGGNLVLALTHKLIDDGLPVSGGIVACSPVTQFLHYAYSYYECSCKTDYGIIFGINQVAELYRGELPLDHPYLSPLCGDFHGFPPTYLDASNIESLRDDARMMYVRLKEDGVDAEYHELRDFFHAMLTRPNVGFVRREEYPHIVRFLRRVFQDTE